MTVCHYHVKYAFQSKYTLYSCLKVKELLAQIRHDIWSSSDWPNDWAVLWVLICTVHLTVCYCNVTYAFQNESKLYSCSNVKELLARNRRGVWSLNIEVIWSRRLLSKNGLPDTYVTTKSTKLPESLSSTYLFKN